MTNGTNQSDIMELESAIQFFYEKFSKNEVNHFDVLGVPKTATHKEIEAAYRKYSAEFSPERISLIGNLEGRKKGEFLMERGKKAYETIIDFEKRAEYEKKGFRDVDPAEEKDEDAEETAKVYYKKAKSLKTMKQFDNAIKVMEEAVKLDPTKPAYHLLLGLCQTQLPEHRRKAEASLLKAAEMESWNAEPFAALGMLFYAERLYKRAEGYFRKALELEPKHQLAREKLTEIVGPEIKPVDKAKSIAKGTLKKVFPSFFGKK